MISREKIIEKLEKVMDPEICVDIWSMGLVYDIVINKDDSVHILMTLTTPMCPAGPYLADEVKKEILSLGAKDVKVDFTFEPKWSPPEGLREAMGI